MDDADELLGGARGVGFAFGLNQLLADVILDDLGDEAVHRAPAGRRLLQRTLMLLVPVLIVNQEKVLRLGVVTGVGHARLILERFGKFRGAFGVTTYSSSMG